jgi:uncharacterized protein YndB with AHSA1/START domain
MSRIDRCSRVIEASPEAVYAAMTDPDALVDWLPPDGMSGEILQFDLRPGGHCRMVLRYCDPAISGKSGDNADISDLRFLDLVPGSLVSQSVDFVSDDPRFAGTMVMHWKLLAVPQGTEVTMEAHDVPEGISQADHLAGMNASLDNLERFLAG